jgi:chromosome segregation ATPase
MYPFRVILPFTLIVISLTSVGCSSGYNKGTKASESIMSTADKLAEGRAQIDKVNVSLTNLSSAQAGQDLRPLYKDYSSNVDKLDSIAADVRKQAEDMRAKGQAYFTEWEAEQAKINNEDIKTRSVQRRAEVEQTFSRISDKSQALKNAYQPLMSDLKDIRTALNNDLTPGGVAAIKPIADRVNKEGVAVKVAAGAVEDEFKGLGVSMSAAGK